MDKTSIPHPSDNVSIFYKFYVIWLTPLIQLANERPLVIDDVYDCPNKERTNDNFNRVWNFWLKEKELNGSSASLAKALFNGFTHDFLAGAFYLFMFMTFQLGQPYFVGELIKNVTEKGDLGQGVGFAIGLGLVSLCSSISFTNSVTVSRRLGVSVRSGIMMSVYSHSLNINSVTRQASSVGQVTNLMSIDSEKLFLCAQFFHYIWYGPLSCMCVFLLLVQVLGYEISFAGLALVLVIVLSQNKVAKLIGMTRNRMLKHTDERVKLVNESLQGIRMIKVYGWEFPMEQKILHSRSKELKELFTYLGLNALLREVMFIAGPLAVYTMAVTSVYAVNRKLTVVKVFKLLSFINILRFPLNLLAQSLKMFNDAKISVQRLQKFFSLSTRETSVKSTDDNDSVFVQNATFSWSEKLEDNSSNDDDSVSGKRAFKLENINFQAKKGELVAIIGAVGSGKSTFISSLLGEVPLWKGELKRCNGCVAYCAQSPWIQNLTLRGNVLFGLNYDEMKDDYEGAVYAAALIPDFNQLPSNDLTEIGERGINLSGGQKSRVSIARALLSSKRACNVIVMDDPFSAVDGETGNWIFEKGVLEYLNGKLRIIALNSHMHLLKKFDRIIILDQGRIIAEGSPQYLAQSNAHLLKRVTGMSDFLENDNSIVKKDDIGPEVKKDENKTKKLIQVEVKAVGAVRLTTFVQYFASILGFLDRIPSTPYYEEKAGTFDSFANYDLKTITNPKFLFGFFYLVILKLAFGLGQLGRLSVDYYLAKWSRDTGDAESKWSTYYLVAIAILAGTQFVRSSLVNITAIQSSKYLHQTILRSILSASVPLFFDVKTTGEILNRFAKDTEAVDSSVPDYLHQVLLNWFQVLSIFALCIWTSPWFVLILVPLTFAYKRLFSFFASVSRDLKRIESISRSPLYASFSETLTGINTIRAYDCTQRFFMGHLQRMDNNHKVNYHLWCCMNWVTARLETSTSFCLLAISLLAVCLRESVDPISLGLALSQGLLLTALLQRSVQIAIDLQTYMTSTERVIEYFTVCKEKSTLTQEAITCEDEGHKGTDIGYVSINMDEKKESNIIKDVSISSTWNKQQVLKDWPVKGVIEFNDVYMNYRDNPPVLKGVSFRFNSAERIGIVGRTGAGKSSIFVALYRVQEISKGTITIDGFNTANIPLQVLRKRLAIIPQDPTLFIGSIRFNLDPFEEYSDDQINKVLSQVCLLDYVNGLDKKLLETVREKGENFSQGQKQLLCIARALLLDAKILLIDEGTSAVDPHTDKLIQEILKQLVTERGMTLLTVAHRLQTILDYDKILVLGDGRVLEMDTPANLQSKHDSIFSNMMKELHKQ